MNTSSTPAILGSSTASSTPIPKSGPSSSDTGLTSTTSQSPAPRKASSPEDGSSRMKELILRLLQESPVGPKSSGTPASAPRRKKSPRLPHSPSFTPPQNQA